jgi:hypothetical protein
MPEIINLGSPSIKGFPTTTLNLTSFDSLAEIRDPTIPVGSLIHAYSAADNLTKTFVVSHNPAGFADGTVTFSNNDTLGFVELGATTKGEKNLTPIMTYGSGFPYSDVDAEAVIVATGITDAPRGENHYRRLIPQLKKDGLWPKLESGFLFGSEHQDSATAIKPFKGAANATGTGTNSPYFVTLNGSSHGYTVPNAAQTAAATGRTFVAIYRETVSAQATNVLVSGAEATDQKGMSMTVGGTPLGATGSTTTQRLYGFGSSDGGVTDSAEYEQVNVVENANDMQMGFAALSHLDGRLTIMGNSFDSVAAQVSDTVDTIWMNRANYGIGKTANGAYFFDGEIAAVLIFDEGLTNEELFKLRLALESILGDALDYTPGILFEGTSLTATGGNNGASGGGAIWPDLVMANAAWTGIRNENIAKGGELQTKRIEHQYYFKARRWVSATQATHIYCLWTGVNDITAGVSAADLIGSIRRTIISAKNDGFFVVLLPITPVNTSAVSTDASYAYSSGQASILTEVNAWIAGEGASIVDQFLNINLIPELADPLDLDYYSAGTNGKTYDGLHQNAAGRALISAYFLANVSVPT